MKHLKKLNDSTKESTKTLLAFLSVKTIAARYELSEPSIWRMSREGTIPKPIKIGGSTRWSLADIEAWEAMKGGEK